jgi:hypothetical protein
VWVQCCNSQLKICGYSKVQTCHLTTNIFTFIILCIIVLPALHLMDQLCIITALWIWCRLEECLALLIQYASVFIQYVFIIDRQLVFCSSKHYKSVFHACHLYMSKSAFGVALWSHVISEHCGLLKFEYIVWRLTH